MPRDVGMRRQSLAIPFLMIAAEKTCTVYRSRSLSVCVLGAT
jgi:hypothetical protein